MPFQILDSQAEALLALLPSVLDSSIPLASGAQKDALRELYTSLKRQSKALLRPSLSLFALEASLFKFKPFVGVVLDPPFVSADLKPPFVSNVLESPFVLDALLAVLEPPVVGGVLKPPFIGRESPFDAPFVPKSPGSPFVLNAVLDPPFVLDAPLSVLPPPFIDIARKASGKRTASDAMLAERAERRKRRPPKSSVLPEDDYGPGTRQRGRAAGSGWRCPRGGDALRITRAAARNGIASSVGAMRNQLLAELAGEASNSKTKNGKGGKKGKQAKSVVWTTDGEPPVATREPALRIVQLSLVAISLELQNNLADLINSIQKSSLAYDAPATPSRPSSEISPFVMAMTRCASLEKNQVMNDFDLMMAYIRASFYIEQRLKVPKGTRVPSYESLAKEVGLPTVTAGCLQNWYKAGTRLIYLAASSSMYIIPLIAAAGLKRILCKEDSIETLIIPQMVFIHQVTTQLKDVFSLDFPPHESGSIEVIPFQELDRMSERLRRFDFNYFQLPPLAQCWDALKNPIHSPVLPLTLDNMNITEECVLEEITIKTELDLKETPCPVNPENSDSWTKSERTKAAAAPMAESIDDLRNKLDDLHRGGERNSDEYVGIPTEICAGNDELLAMVITNIAELLPHLVTRSFGRVTPNRVMTLPKTSIQMSSGRKEVSTSISISALHILLKR
ncbi:hypothetical protein B0H15DRAFT_802778 [Mycena belliarum]|uniref:Uncharacterized protein n=1 Tax=Mycena belliarum TaxID=1033014 RepID=A0AAD6TY38_9AGAR|nr:hypothetical protein B0H15DRAFT_802778 [Mycena belliae]